MSSYERWSLIASFGSLIISAIVFGTLVWQLRLLSSATRIDHERRRKQATLEYLSTLQERQLRFRDLGIPANRDAQAIGALLAKGASGDLETSKIIDNYVTMYNLIGIAGQTDVFDMELIEQAWGGTIVAVYENYRPWITRERQIRSEPRIWDDLEWLAGRITPRRVVAAPAQSEH